MAKVAVVLASAAFVWGVFRPGRRIPAAQPVADEPELASPPEADRATIVAQSSAPEEAVQSGGGPVLFPPDETWVPTFAVTASAAARPLALVSSLLLHCTGLLILPMVADLLPPLPRSQSEPVRYSFRMLKLSPPIRTPRSPAPDRAVKASAPVVAVRKEPKATAAEGGKPSPPPRFRVDLPFREAQSTLVQSDVPATVPRRDDVRVPNVVILQKKRAPAKALLTPPPEVDAKLLSAAPSLVILKVELPRVARPAPEPVVKAEVLPPVKRAQAPVQVDTPDPGTKLPETVSEARESTAGQVISVSDLALPPAALIAVPTVNQVAKARADVARTGVDALAPDGAEKVAAAEKAKAAAAERARAESVSRAAIGKAGAGETKPDSSPDPLPSDTSGISGSSESSGTAAAAPQRPADPNRIERPMNGKHSAVVMGGSSTQVYPETAGALSCSLIYTVYLQVGLPRSWILQFCQPDQGGGTEAASALDAPWPFVLMRPSLADLAGDYTVVHGFVNAAGRLENLSLVTPDEKAKTQLLEPLRKWEFRPTMRDGKPTAVEVLLIIPHRRN